MNADTERPRYAAPPGYAPPSKTVLRAADAETLARMFEQANRYGEAGRLAFLQVVCDGVKEARAERERITRGWWWWGQGPPR
jgi:hypothetical protein